jgi:hypothetical protein
MRRRYGLDEKFGHQVPEPIPGKLLFQPGCVERGAATSARMLVVGKAAFNQGAEKWRLPKIA